MRVSIDEHKCVASGQCAWVAPQVFDQSDEDGSAVLLSHSPPAELHDAVREAGRVCPAGAIAIHER